MPGVESSQGTAVSFDGVVIGYLTGFDIEAKAGSLTDATSVLATVVGTGADSRVVRYYDCTSVEPPTVSITFWGPPTFTPYDCGMKAVLAFESFSSSLSGEAILVSFNYSGRTNQYTTGSATFQLTGAPAA